MPLTNPTTVTAPSEISSAGAPATVESSATDEVLLAANSSRKGATVYNSSTARLYVALGGPASTALFTALLEPGGYYEVPFFFTGAIHGVWASANGSALVTELT